MIFYLAAFRTDGSRELSSCDLPEDGLGEHVQRLHSMGFERVRVIDASGLNQGIATLRRNGLLSAQDARHDALTLWGVVNDVYDAGRTG